MLTPHVIELTRAGRPFVKVSAPPARSRSGARLPDARAGATRGNVSLRRRQQRPDAA